MTNKKKQLAQELYTLCGLLRMEREATLSAPASVQGYTAHGLKAMVNAERSLWLAYMRRNAVFKQEKKRAQEKRDEEQRKLDTDEAERVEE